MNKIYADNAATTPISDRVLFTMLPYLKENYGNPSALYKIGRTNKFAIEKAREKVAKAIGAEPREIYFTSGGSESDNWAIKGTAEMLGSEGKKHIITSKIEHHAVLNTCKYLESKGFEITYIPVDKQGFVNPEDIKNLIRNDTALVSIMYANNEIGTIQPINEIAKICKEKGVLFHTDAVQAIGHIEINVHEQGIDMLSLSGHKFHAPKGIGALYIRRGVQITNLIDGGGQEYGFRAGTENVAAIVGIGTAIEEVTVKGSSIIAQKRNELLEKLKLIPCIHINGSMLNRLDNNINISFEGIESESLVLLLDIKGICVSAGSACNSASIEPSHVLKAIGLSDELARSAIRITIDETITCEQIDYLYKSIKECVERLRQSSPVWQNKDDYGRTGISNC